MSDKLNRQKAIYDHKVHGKHLMKEVSERLCAGKRLVVLECLCTGKRMCRLEFFHAVATQQYIKFFLTRTITCPNTSPACMIWEFEAGLVSRTLIVPS